MAECYLAWPAARAARRPSPLPQVHPEATSCGSSVLVLRSRLTSALICRGSLDHERVLREVLSAAQEIRDRPYHPLLFVVPQLREDRQGQHFACCPLALRKIALTVAQESQ